MRVVPVPVRQDNYAYLLIDEPSSKAAVVDIFDVAKVTAAAQELGVEIIAALTTHHHFDHSGGNKNFAVRYPGIPIYGGSDKVEAVTKLAKDGEEIRLGDNIHIRCMATPCHTQDSICYYVTEGGKKAIFTGDTLFIAGCGRFFEGSAEEMIRALSYLGTLPSDTIVYPGHEYTAGNLSFAKSVEHDNSALERLAYLVRNHTITSGQSTIGDEKEWNVFMRLGSVTIRNAVSATKETPEIAVMDKVRDMKNNFKA